MTQNPDINPTDWAKFESSIRKKEEQAENKKQQRRDLRKKFETLKPDSLCTALRQGLGEYRWSQEGHPTGMNGQQRVDLVGRPNLEDYLVFIEVEGGRTHPIDNVVKAWRYVDEVADSKPVLLIQMFSPYFYVKSGNKRRMTEAIFIGKHAEKVAIKKFRYASLGQEYWPPSKDSKLDLIVQRIALLITDYRRKE